MVFLALILVPITRRPQYRGIASSLIHLTGIRFRWVGWISLALLLVTGFINLAERVLKWADLWDETLWMSPFGRVLILKLLLVGVILVLSVFHDFFVGPRATALLQSNPASPDALRLRRRASWIGRLNLILALMAVALGVMLVRGSPL